MTPCAAAQEESAPVPQEEEEDDDHLDEIFAGMLEEDQMVGEDGEAIELDEDELAAVEAVDELISTDRLEAIAEGALAAELAEGDEAEIARLQRRAEFVFSEAAAGRGGSPQEQDIVLESAAARLAEGAATVEAEEVDDVQNSYGFSKYDEDEEAGMTPEQKDIVQNFKLTKQELKNLLPSTWDSINIDWFANKKDTSIPLPEYKLNLLWMDKNIAVAVDQVYSRGQTSPLTEYFFWPRKDAWDELKTALEQRPWILERDKVVLLNRLTQIINFWQDEAVKHTMEEARANFPDCSFSGA